MNSIELDYKDMGLVRICISSGNTILTVCGKSIPIGRTYKTNVIDLLL